MGLQCLFECLCHRPRATSPRREKMRGHRAVSQRYCRGASRAVPDPQHKGGGRTGPQLRATGFGNTPRLPAPRGEGQARARSTQHSTTAGYADRPCLLSHLLIQKSIYFQNLENVCEELKFRPNPGKGRSPRRHRGPAQLGRGPLELSASERQGQLGGDGGGRWRGTAGKRMLIQLQLGAPAATPRPSQGEQSLYRNHGFQEPCSCRGREAAGGESWLDALPPEVCVPWGLPGQPDSQGAETKEVTMER